MASVVRYKPGRWDLSPLLPEPTPSVIQQRLAALEEAVRAFEAHRDRLRPDMSPATLLEILRQYEQLVEEMRVLASYGELWFSENTLSSEALAYRNRVRQVLTDYQNRVLFFELWWKSLSDEEAERLLPTAAQHADYRHFLLSQRRLKPYTLDERSEQLINLKNASGVDALVTIYSMLTNRLEFTLEVNGERKRLTRAELTTYVSSPDATLRAAAYKEMFRVFEQEAPILAQIYINRVRDWYNEYVRVRGFSTPIAARNLFNDIPDAAVEVLLEVCRQNAPLFQRYFRLKARWLGMPKLRRYDIYAPLTTSDRRIPYEEAVELVLTTLREFDPHVAAQAERVFAEHHVDSEVRPGKRTGAFCMTVSPRYTPWVLLNYTERIRDVATMAHELGHAIHSLLASHHSILTQHPPLPLAETASVFTEMLLTDRLLAQEQDPEVRREILGTALDDIYATVMRQAYFVLFEIAAHDAIREGAAHEDLNRLYMENLREQFGDSLELTDDFQHEWVAVPHFYHTPFYCYAYSFGQLLVLALYRRYKQEGESFKPKYLRLLSYGGAGRPVDILQEVDVDITDPQFWQLGFDVIREFVEQLETLVPVRG